MKLQKIRLGKTNLKVSRIGLGIGGIFGMKIFDQKKAISIIEKSLENGINFFDTGSSYSYGNAEILLGKALYRKNLDDIIIATKGGTVLGKRNMIYKDFSKDSLRLNLEKSLKKLKIEKINLFQLHSPKRKDLNEDVFEILNSFKEEGKIDHIGISCDGIVLEKALKTNFFDTIMCTYNLINRTADEQLKIAKNRNVGVIIKSPMAHQVFNKNIFNIKNITSLWYFLRILKNYKSQLIKGYKFRFLNNFDNLSSSQIALKFVIDNEYVDLALVGTTKIRHLEQNVDCLFKSLPPEIHKKLNDYK